MFNKQEIFLVLVIALCHDIGHKGKNNQYYKKTKHKLFLNAINESILETYHIQQIFKLLKQERTNIFDYLSPQVSKEYKEIVMESILGTDNSQHFAIMQSWEESAEVRADKRAVIRFILHACDIGNSTLDFYNYINSSKLVVQEFHNQFMKEREKGVNAEGFMKYTDQADFFNGQSQFLETFVTPIFYQLSMQFEGLDYFARKSQQNLKLVKLLNHGIQKENRYQ